MTLTRFERLLPWSGAVAGLCWVGQDALQKMYSKDAPGHAPPDVIHDHLALNYGVAGVPRRDGDRSAVLRDRGPQPAALG